MSRKVLVLLLLLISSTVLSQHTIDGKIIDVDNKALPYVNVLLLSQIDSTLVQGTISGDGGHFKLDKVPKGEYLLNLSYIGFESTERNISINKNFSTGEIIMKEQAESLEEVVIVANKPLYEQKIDRLIVNVKNSVTSAGSTALEVLERSPGVAVERATNSISMNGKDGLLIMVNGKISRQPISSIMQMLDGMNAENIERIELITTPPAKYEAGGNAGIIDIRLVRSADLGTNGTISATLGYGKKDKEGFNLILNHRKNKVNLYSDLSFSRNHGYEIFTNDRVINNTGETLTYQTISNRNPISTNFNAKVGLDYQLGENTLIGAFISGFYSNWDMIATNIGFEKSSLNPTINFNSDNTELSRLTNISGNINLQQKISDRAELSIDVDYLRYDGLNPTSYQNVFKDEMNSIINVQFIEASKKTPIDIWTTKTDYTNKINDELKLEFGLKGIFSNLNNNVDIQEEMNGVFVRNDELSEFSTLKERIGAAYASVSYSINDKTDLNIGLRYEHTTTDLSSLSEGVILDLDYGNLFPTLFLSRTLSERSKLNFSYSKRITRPSYNDLAPFVIFLDPNTFFFGNTELQPATSNNLKFNYSLNKTLFSIDFNHESNAIARYQPIVLESGQQVFTSLNLDSRKTFSFLVSQRYSIARWWDGSINLLGVHRDIRTKEDEEIKINYIRINGSQSFKLPKEITFEISGIFQTKSKYGVSVLSNYSNMTLGLQKKFSKESKLRLTLNNVFGFKYDDSTAKDLNVNYYTNTNYLYEPRILKLTYTYSFGNSKLKNYRNRSTGSEDIKSRVN